MIKKSLTIKLREMIIHSEEWLHKPGSKDNPSSIMIILFTIRTNGVRNIWEFYLWIDSLSIIWFYLMRSFNRIIDLRNKYYII